MRGARVRAENIIPKRDDATRSDAYEDKRKIVCSYRREGQEGRHAHVYDALHQRKARRALYDKFGGVLTTHTFFALSI